MAYNSIYEILKYQAKKRPNKNFLIFKDKLFTYVYFKNLVDRLAEELSRRFAVTKGEICCISMSNSPIFLEIWFALNKLGAVLAPLNPDFTEYEARNILEKIKPRLCFVDDSTEVIIRGLRTSTQILNKTVVGKCELSIQKIKRLRSLSTKLASREDTACIIFTSGTTGPPKGVILSNNSYIVGGEAFSYRSQLSEKDVVMAILPLFHINAQAYSTVGTLVSGATLLLLKKFSASMFWHDAVKNNATQVNIIGAIANILLKQDPCQEERAHRIKLAFGGGITRRLVNQYRQRFNILLLQPYSLTESPMVTSNTLTHNKPGSVGLPAEHPNSKYKVFIKIVDNTGRQIRNGKIGEIVIKTPVLANGYYQNQKATRESFKNGWFYTGDYGKLDRDGYLYFIDRKKDIIRKNGQNLSPAQVEQVISRLTQVSEVAVIPVPAPLGEDNVKALIVLKSRMKISIREIKKHCRKYLTKYKIPNIIEFRRSLPKTATEKIAKNKLVKMERVKMSNINQPQIGLVTKAIKLLSLKYGYDWSNIIGHRRCPAGNTLNVAYAIEELLNNHNLTVDHLKFFSIISKGVSADTIIANYLDMKASRIRNIPPRKISETIRMGITNLTTTTHHYDLLVDLTQGKTVDIILFRIHNNAISI